MSDYCKLYLQIFTFIPYIFIRNILFRQQPKDASALELRTLLPTLFGIQLGDKEIEELEDSLNAISEKPYLVRDFFQSLFLNFCL